MGLNLSLPLKAIKHMGRPLSLSLIFSFFSKKGKSSPCNSFTSPGEGGGALEKKIL